MEEAVAFVLGIAAIVATHFVGAFLLKCAARRAAKQDPEFAPCGRITEAPECFTMRR